MSTKPEQHDVVRGFAKSLKPPIRLSLPALETLAVIAYKQPVTVPEISEIRGVDSSGVIATLLDRKLITTAGRKAVIGRPILYKTTKEFLLRFGLKDVKNCPAWKNSRSWWRNRSRAICRWRRPRLRMDRRLQSSQLRRSLQRPGGRKSRFAVAGAIQPRREYLGCVSSVKL